MRTDAIKHTHTHTHHSQAIHVNRIASTPAVKFDSQSGTVSRFIKFFDCSFQNSSLVYGTLQSNRMMFFIRPHHFTPVALNTLQQSIHFHLNPHAFSLSHTINFTIHCLITPTTLAVQLTRVRLNTRENMITVDLF